MKNSMISKPVRPFFVVVFLAVLVASGLLAWKTPFREAATVVLFIPVIWGFMTLSGRGMIAIGLLVCGARLGVETLQQVGLGQEPDFLKAVLEALFPCLLYLVLGVAFYLYRRQLENMYQQLTRSRSMEAVQQLTGGLAHDLSNVVQVVMGMAHLLRENKSLDAQARKDAEEILQVGHHAAELVNDMRGFAYRSRELEQLDIGNLLKEQMVLIRRAMPRSIRLVEDFTPAPLMVFVDKVQIGRMLMNLYTNARDAMSDGGTLTISTRRIQNDSGKKQARIAVTDTGKGIDARQMKKIFEPFYTMRQAQGGSGLGLAIVRSIVQTHNGTIQVESTPGEGSSFIILLPLTETGNSEN